MSEERSVSAVARAFLGETAADFAEVALDSAFEAGVFQDLPVIGTVMRAARSGRSAYDAILLGKFMAFAMHVDEATAEQRAEWSTKLAPPGERERFQRNLMFLIEKLDDAEKAPLLARAFNATVRGELKLREFQRYAEIILASNVEHLRELHDSRTVDKKRGEQIVMAPELARPLEAQGLIEVSTTWAPGASGAPPSWKHVTVLPFGRDFTKRVIRIGDGQPKASKS